jgi:hypothetical protein
VDGEGGMRGEEGEPVLYRKAHSSGKCTKHIAALLLSTKVELLNTSELIQFLLVVNVLT